MTAKSMDAIMALCKRRGFIYQASEIYGGINGFWDYGPLGAQMKKNLRDAWWQDMILNPCWGRKGPGGQRVHCVPLETCIIQHPKVWEASGHVAGFNDPMVDDKETKQRFRADQLQGVYAGQRHGPEAERKKLAARLESEKRGSGWSHPPKFTLIASTIGEAFQSIQEDKKVQKRLGMTLLGGHLVSHEVAVVYAEEGDFVAEYVLAPVTLNDLTFKFEEIPSPYTNKRGQLMKPRQFNLMFMSYVGATASEDDKVYLRPETAQGIFVQFKNVVDTSRVKVPFGIGNTGRSFRNEITPRNFTFRSREFEQAELEFFCHPDESLAWYDFWRKFRLDWWESLGLAGENLRIAETDKKDLAHYSQAGSDVEYRFPFTAPGFGELEGVAHRGCFDLTQHQQHSGVKQDYFDQDRGELLPNGSKKGERYIPHVIEPAAGLDRGALALICEGYTRDESRPSPEFLKLHPRIAPIKAAVFPLVNKEGMPEVAEKLHAELAKRFGHLGFIETDAKQSIGKRYARMDEAGCPFCFTIDGETMKDQTVTVRDRDTGSQERIAIDKVPAMLGERLLG